MDWLRHAIPWWLVLGSLLGRGLRRPMTPDALRKAIELLPAESPVTDDFTDSWGYVPSDQRAHWLGWLEHYDGPGAYGRKHGKTRTAEYVYAHIANPFMLMYLAEAVGLPLATLEEAGSAAFASLDAGGSDAASCAAFRAVVPWGTIQTALPTV